MYIEYKTINGILHVRYNPADKFKECTKEHITRLLNDEEEESKRYRRLSRQMYEALKEEVAFVESEHSDYSLPLGDPSYCKMKDAIKAYEEEQE